MKTKNIFLSTLSAAFVFASVAGAAQAASDYVMLKIDNTEIKKSEVETIWKGLFPEGKAPDFEGFKENVKQNVLRGIVSEHVIYSKANKSGVADSVEVKEKLAGIKKKIVTQVFLEKETKGLVSEATIKAEYNKQIAKLKGQKEMHARHILVKTEAEAKEVIKKLKDGAKFEELAKEKSTDKGSAVRGGDLGYFTKERMVPEFSKAAFEMKKGDVSKEPVKSQFGWHIIKVEDKRDVKVPDYKQAKPMIEQQLQGDALKKYIDDMVDSASVEYFDKNGKPLELTRTKDTTK